ncbi:MULTISPECIES: TIGR02680 family protein [unclassified Clostridium]|uniref:TIGR02680 family protein n=1 Tax=unclassified Clostridium TaxID=2614128 RepID=UPI003F911DE0
MKERWIANKFGLFNFWCYDEEEFQLLNGKILLRGSNGSGKSVTTQSFIPLLLDGNKSPSRIDPFGSTARKMENYLLDDNHEDRIAYLYIEFKKPESNLYITIGMGMRAQKSKSMNSWYFILKDGRRINKDFKLYKNLGGKYPLTKQQFKNALGEGNFFTEGQREYMNKVNEHLFGFSDIENYEELLKLLIEIRSPKLSKEFKPTKIYTILNNSQKTLSEDDLRPMAEAMDNMDSLNMKLMALEKSLKAGESLKETYHNYNKYILFSKSKDYLEKEVYVNNLIKEREKLLNNIEELKTQKGIREKEAEALKEKYNKARVEYEELIKDDIFSTKSELENLKREISEEEKEISRLTGDLDKKREDIKQKEKVLENVKEEKDYLNGKIIRELDELNSYGEEFYFEEGKLLKNELLRDIEGYDFTFLKESLNREEKKLDEGFKAIKQYEELKNKKEECELEKDKIDKIVEGLNSELKESCGYFINIKEEYMEKINIYNTNNRELTLKEEEIQKLFKIVSDIERKSHLESLKPIVSDAYNNFRGKLLIDKQRLSEEKKVKLDNIKELENEIKNLKEEKEAEFILEEEVLSSRQKLKDKGIPFIPFYKAFNFIENLSEEEKKFIESSLIDMGIINSLIVPNKYKNGLMDITVKDKYLFVENGDLSGGKNSVYESSYITEDGNKSNNLSTFLKMEDGEFIKLYKKELQVLLQNIAIEEDKSTYINNNGIYNIGIIRGKTTSNHELKYIGEESRKRYREYLIKEKFQQIDSIKFQISSIEESLKYLEEKITILQKEYEAFPSIQDLRTNLELIEEKEDEIKRKSKELLELKEKYLQLNKSLEQVKIKVFEKTSEISIEKNSKCFEDALDALRDYEKTLSEVQVMIEKFKGYSSKILSIEEQIEYIKEYVDRLWQNISNLSKKIKDKSVKAQGLQEVLVKSNLKDIEKAIENAKNIVDIYPDKITQVCSSVTTIDNKIENNMEKQKEKEHKINREKELLKILEENLTKEIELNYIEINLIDNLKEKAKYVIENYKDEGSKDAATYAKELFESIGKYEGDLREYNLKYIEIFKPEENIEDEEKKNLYMKGKRIEIVLRFNGKVSLYNLVYLLREVIEEQKLFINERERQIFEETLINTISTKITAKIYQTKIWVDEMNELMESMNTSSGLKFSLKWVPRKAENENQMDISSLVNILQRGAVVTEDDVDKLSKHFKEKLKQQKRDLEASGEIINYQSIIKDILDYRQWYEFKLSFTKPLDGKKELTDNEFFKFSGGEKAMAMYVPLFAAVNAKYNGADKKDCPRIIALDEAFAGVDENNISDMFKLLEKMNLDYVLNSQVLWGDYETVKELAICELTRDGEDDIVVVERFQWNGKEKVIVLEGEDIG